VFDLDDTLVKEIDYLKSAFREIARIADPEKVSLFDDMFQWYQDKENVFDNLCRDYSHLNVGRLRDIYRNHLPEFDALSENRALLLDLKRAGHFIGLITDGYSVTQRNKVKALDMTDLFDKIVISEEFGFEKPHEGNYREFDEFGSSEKIYVGDNLGKDFVTANRLGWKTICLLDDGRNIHAQDFDKKAIYLPAITVASLSELREIIIA
ncbi:MAG: HAD family hydrolase, partial [Proteobacteria bacterium]